jgi:hypothetical protein
MKLLLHLNIFTVLLLFTSTVSAQSLNKGQQESIERFVKLVESKNWEVIAQFVNYPIDRNYPIPDVESEAELIVRHTELFDDSLIAMISKSLTDSTWSVDKNSLLTLQNGVLSIDSLGKLTLLNYESAYSKNLEQELIDADRASLPVTFQDYERPILQMKTEKFRVRIDETKGPSFRMIVWIEGNRNPNMPAVNIIPNGVLARSGANGNYTYTFKSDLGTFVCFISEFKEDGSLPADLLLYRDNKLVRVYPAISLQK